MKAHSRESHLPLTHLVAECSVPLYSARWSTVLARRIASLFVCANSIFIERDRLRQRRVQPLALGGRAELVAERRLSASARAFVSSGYPNQDPSTSYRSVTEHRCASDGYCLARLRPWDSLRQHRRESKSNRSSYTSEVYCGGLTVSRQRALEF